MMHEGYCLWCTFHTMSANQRPNNKPLRMRVLLPASCMVGGALSYHQKDAYRYVIRDPKLKTLPEGLPVL